MGISAAYLRVSSQRQGEQNKASIPQQKAACERLARERGDSIARWFIDKEHYRSADTGRLVQPSGERSDRPAFVAMLGEVRSGKVSRIYAWAQDRIARGTRSTATFREIAEQMNLEIVFAEGNWDADTADIMGAIGGFELRRIKQRMQLGRLGRLQKGLHGGQAPFGYSVIRDGLGKNVGYKFEPRYRKCFDKLAEYFIERLPYVEIRRRVLNPDTGEPFKLPSLRYIFRSRFYHGYLDYSKRIGFKGVARPAVKATHQPAWDAETCGALDRELKRRMQSPKSGPRKRKYDYALAGVLHCGICGRTLAAGSPGQNLEGRPYINYCCNTPGEIKSGIIHRHYRNHEGNCISERKALALIAQLLQSLQGGDVEAFTAAYSLASAGRAPAPDETILSGLEAKIQELQQGFDAVKHIPASALALEGELKKAKRELADLLAEQRRRSERGEVDRKSFSRALRAAITDTRWLENPDDPIQLQQRLRSIFPGIYIAHGQLVLPPTETK